MNVKDIRDGMRKVDVTGELIEIGVPRAVQLRTGGEGEVADAIIEDETGEIKLSLWDSDINKVATGDTVRIENGYVTTFRGEMQLNVGRYGTINIEELQQTEPTPPKGKATMGKKPSSTTSSPRKEFRCGMCTDVFFSSADLVKHFQAIHK